MRHGLTGGELRSFHHTLLPENRSLGTPGELHALMDAALVPVQSMVDWLDAQEERARAQYITDATLLNRGVRVFTLEDLRQSGYL